MSSPILHFITPPIPYFIDCGRAHYDAGDYHISRNCIGVFDLIIVKKGILPIAENDLQWELKKANFSSFVQTHIIMASPLSYRNRNHLDSFSDLW